LPAQINGTFIIVLLGAVSALLAGACVAPVVIGVLLLSADLYLKGQFIGVLLPFLLGIGMALPWPFAGAGFSFLPKPGKWMLNVKYFFAAVILLTAGYYLFVGGKLLYDHHAAGGQARADEGWSDVSDGMALEQTAQPVLIYFWASWCKTCHAMSATTLRDKAVRAKMDRFIRFKFQADNPDDPAVKRVLNEFGVKGLPTFVILERKNAE
jgi:thioredoxin:protein disulfide reductase